MKSPLEDVKVIEYGNLIVAPFCSKLLADLGAEVIKIEEPIRGDIARRRGPFLNDIPGNNRSGLFLYLNTNKLGITLNLDKATGTEIFKKLIKSADILIEDTEPGKMAELGLDYSRLESLNPSLVMTSITPFGQTGPYKDYKSCDLTGWHMSGAGYVTPRNAGTVEQEPLKVVHMSDYITGILAAVAALGAFQLQRHTGLGQAVDISGFEAMTQFAGWANVYWPYAHENATRASRSWLAPQHYLKCKDGWIYVLCAEEHHWRAFVDMMGNPEWANEELFKDMISRGEYWESLQPLIEEWTSKYTRGEIFELSKTRKLPLTPVQSVKELLESRQLKERAFFAEIEHPEVGKLIYPGAPFKFSETPCSIRRPAPLLGQHNIDIYCGKLGYTKQELIKMYEVGII